MKKMFFDIVNITLWLVGVATLGVVLWSMTIGPPAFSNQPPKSLYSLQIPKTLYEGDNVILEETRPGMVRIYLYSCNGSPYIINYKLKLHTS